MKVLLDISNLGLGVILPETRAGGFRSDQRIIEELARSGECELAFCANHSSITYGGALEYVRTHPTLSRYPLLGPGEGATRSVLRRGMTRGYRWFRTLYPVGPLPGVVRTSGLLFDRGVHQPVTNTPEGADIFHSTQFPLPAKPHARSLQRFLTIYDLRHRRFPHLYDERSIAVSRTSLESVGPSDWVITSSEASREELLATGAVERRQVFVVLLAADPDRFYPCRDLEMLQRVRARYGIGDGPYVLSVNSMDIRKNMHQAVRAFTRVVRQERVGDLKFVIAGTAGSGSQLMQTAIADAGVERTRIVQIGFVADEDLAALYSGATAFLYPSIYEGFGLPPLEAMQCGTPVITSNASSLPEVVGDAGLMVGADDLDALSAAILELVTSSDLRDALARKSIARAAQFSWERTAAAVLDSYRFAIKNQ